MQTEQSTITQTDELLLRRYFGGREPAPRGSSDTFEQFSNLVGYDCPVCDGDGYLYCGSARAKRCDRCKGQGRIERKVKTMTVSRAGYSRCPQCHGVGGFNRSCGFCHGEGYSMVLVAFCEHSKEVLAYIDTYSEVAAEQRKTRAAVHALDAQLRACAGAYYGSEGDRWAQTSRGRIFALYEFTGAGKRLLSMSPKAHRQLTPLERIAMLAEADRRIPEPRRTTLLADAYLEAHQMLDEFAAAWSELRHASNG